MTRILEGRGANVLGGMTIRRSDLEGRGANVLGGMTIRRSDLEGGAHEFVERLLEASA